MLKFKIDILEELKKRGYNTTRLRKDKIIPEGTLTKIRKNDGDNISTATLNTICRILNKQPGQLLQYIPDEQETTTE